MLQLSHSALDRWVMQVKPKLIQIAKVGDLTIYSDLRKQFGFGSWWGGQIVGEISLREHKDRRPLLSAIVVNKATRMPGWGFFSLLFGVPENSSGEKWETNGRPAPDYVIRQRRAFWGEEKTKSL